MTLLLLLLQFVYQTNRSTSRSLKMRLQLRLCAAPKDANCKRSLRHSSERKDSTGSFANRRIGSNFHQHLNRHTICDVVDAVRLSDSRRSMQLADQLTVSGLFPELQSANLARHSTETVDLKCTVIEVVQALDSDSLHGNSDIALSGAFDNV